jgi:translation elongation factor aEF-1 beta
MGSAAVKIKIMPDSPSADLKTIEDHATSIIEKEKGKIVKIEREPIAFGLNAVFITFGWQEDAEREVLEVELSKIPHVNSAEVVDFRRAFG